MNNPVVKKLTPAQKGILQELVARMNLKRERKGYDPVLLAKVPKVPGRHVQDYYLVDTYQVRRHWRRRPKRK